MTPSCTRSSPTSTRGILPAPSFARPSSSATRSTTTWPCAISRRARSGPNLAVSWKTIDDTTWEVKLRQGVKFHDGTPFTAKDVKATFERVLDPAKKMIARGNHAKIKSVEVVDDYTVRFKTDGPYPLFVERMTAQAIASEKVIREKGDEWMQEHPVGTGARTSS
jgi:ABC-type dipeptide transport system, periplasmic component